MAHPCPISPIHTHVHRVHLRTFPQVLLQLAELPLGGELVDGQRWGQRDRVLTHPITSLCLSLPSPKLLPLAPPAQLLTVQCGGQG